MESKPVNPGVRAAIFLATWARSRSVLRGFKCTLKMEYLKKEKNAFCLSQCYYSVVHWISTHILHVLYQ